MSWRRFKCRTERSSSAPDNEYYNEKLGKVWYVLRHGNTTPKKLRTFHQALQDLLGANVHVMEKLIANDLHRRLELNFKSHDGWTITDYANHAEVKKHG